MTQQPALFADQDLPLRVEAAVPSAQAVALGAALRERFQGRCRLGTSSWFFPGWAGLVWARKEAPATLTRHGLPAYAQHPLLNSVSLDRAFYRPLGAAEYAQLAAQVPEGFRFVVKAPALLTDSLSRTPETGAALQANPGFLDADGAVSLCAQPAAEGLASKLGALVLQLSPLAPRWLQEPLLLLRRLEAVGAAMQPQLPGSALLALELRDAELLTPALAACLKANDMQYCLGLHDRMPPIDEQLPLLRALWPADLVCRWNLQRGLRYADAKGEWAPFDRLQAPDVETRRTLARVARATLEAGHRVFICINNKAEGCAPESVLALADAILAA